MRSELRQQQCSNSTFLYCTAADAVLVTVPLGVLKKGSIQFQPALPEAKQAAIKRLGMGVMNKVRTQGGGCACMRTRARAHLLLALLLLEWHIDGPMRQSCYLPASTLEEASS